MPLRIPVSGKALTSALLIPPSYPVLWKTSSPLGKRNLVVPGCEGEGNKVIREPKQRCPASLQPKQMCPGCVQNREKNHINKRNVTNSYELPYLVV